MAKKKKRKIKKKGTGGSRSRWVGIGAIGLFCLFTFIFAFYFIFLHQPDFSTKPLEDSVVSSENTLKAYSPSKLKSRPDKADILDNRPLVAIVIDDMGRKEKLGKRFLSLDLVLSFAFLPHTPYAKELTQIAANQGRDVLLHLPMEPLDSRFDPGPGALFTSMADREINSIMQGHLKAFPHIVGVNNHMGSRFTAHKAGMAKVLEIIGENNIFFLDSMTSADSVAYGMAVDMGVKTARRQVFLDNEKDQGKIEAQIKYLIELAEKNGTAIAIGHPYQVTYDALSSTREDLLARVRVVGVGSLMH